MQRRAKGALVEAAALAHLTRAGLREVATNAHFRFGELDLVLLDARTRDETLVFVEVRARRSDAFGGAAASITAAKRRRIVAAARHYLAARGSARACRFDAVLLHGDERRIEWIENAFGE